MRAGERGGRGMAGCCTWGARRFGQQRLRVDDADQRIEELFGCDGTALVDEREGRGGTARAAQAGGDEAQRGVARCVAAGKAPSATSRKRVSAFAWPLRRAGGRCEPRARAQARRCRVQGRRTCCRARQASPEAQAGCHYHAGNAIHGARAQPAQRLLHAAQLLGRRDGHTAALRARGARQTQAATREEQPHPGGVSAALAGSRWRRAPRCRRRRPTSARRRAGRRAQRAPREGAAARQASHGEWGEHTAGWPWPARP